MTGAFTERGFGICGTINGIGRCFRPRRSLTRLLDCTERGLAVKATRDRSKKRCPRCRETKPISEFRQEPSRPRGLAIYCRACDPVIRREKYLARKQEHNDYAKRYKQERPAQASEYSRRHSLKKNYGITAEQWDEMFTRQNGCCLLCGEQSTGRRLDVDHCHDTGQVRGLLCNGCNAGIALLKHDPALLAKAITYLSGELVPA